MLMGSLSFALHVVAKLFCFCLCLFDVIVELHAMDEKKIMILSFESESKFSYLIKVYLIRK